MHAMVMPADIHDTRLPCRGSGLGCKPALTPQQVVGRHGEDGPDRGQRIDIVQAERGSNGTACEPRQQEGQHRQPVQPPGRLQHEAVGHLVVWCEVHDCELGEVSDEDLAKVSPHFTPDVRAVLSVPGALAARDTVGGTAPNRVADQLAALRDTVADAAGWAAVAGWAAAGGG